MNSSDIAQIKETPKDTFTLFDIPEKVVDVLHTKPCLRGATRNVDPAPPGFRIDVLSLTDHHEVKRYHYGDLAICDVIRINKPSLSDVEKSAVSSLGDGVHRCFMAHLGVATSREVFYYVHVLYVDPSVRNNGVGRKLLGFVLNQIGPSWVWLCANPEETTDNSVTRMYAFYEDFGFRRFHVASCMMSLTPMYVASSRFGERRSPGNLDPLGPPRYHAWDKDVRGLAMEPRSQQPKDVDEKPVRKAAPPWLDPLPRG